MKADIPQIGHAVRIDGYYYAADPGEIAVVGGFYADDLPYVTLRPRVYWDDYISVSGGPCPGIRGAVLVGTTQIATWRFRNGMRRAHNSETVIRRVPLWSWTGDQR